MMEILYPEIYVKLYRIPNRDYVNLLVSLLIANYFPPLGIFLKNKTQSNCEYSNGGLSFDAKTSLKTS